MPDALMAGNIYCLLEWQANFPYHKAMPKKFIKEKTKLHSGTLEGLNKCHNSDHFSSVKILFICLTNIQSGYHTPGIVLGTRGAAENKTGHLSSRILHL